MENENTRKTGTVVFFSSKHIGFIKSDEDGEELFVHYSAIIMDGYKKLDPGDRVSYEIGSNHKGPCAINVVVEKKARRD